MGLSIVILAAGKGTRMQSNMPKVLHKIASKSMLQHVIDAAQQLQPEQIIVVAGHEIEQVKSSIAEQDIIIAEQSEQLGTGHAVDQALPLVSEGNQVLVLYGDVPLIQKETLKQLIDAQPKDGIGLLTVKLKDPSGYGRIIRNTDGRVTAIVEQKDATMDQLAINEVNTGIMSVGSSKLKQWLAKIDNNNAQGEYYLTDTIAMAADEGGVRACHPSSAIEVEGVNSRIQLAQLERAFQQHQAEQLMNEGVTLIDPSRFDVRGNLICATDVVIDVNVIIEGDVTIGRGSQIGANSIIINSKIGADCIIKPNSVIEGAIIESDCSVGPFARIRPGTQLSQGAFIGNFVETKNTVMGQGSKASHLSYIGDAEVGTGVNIGAGVITCNYDGANKYKTIIEDDAFIGSDSQLIAPVTVGKGATIGAGTTVTKDVAAGELCISRVAQKHIESWARPVKEQTKKNLEEKK
ncbi:bifunctional UDP-N-acetylglucosamine diphosphorylase/glucosamine-1-phosphate N-acetyltransferase GlmU [Kangiella aquimarina]|uniref:Bifunctional protein GlmU n=1 Tax=Kangiella aquimarina TaxID=261965 RepID=A0ABZ0X4X4_9GAMM|nr:bifunctional UDP-N-acetylglucosamine diphosphorylase/glucosamine-1-phosphate N-acetyltransferase GlmU [Kangiella aquimarina]WQG85652.1 bifunctional UDP-N-acetylglucosamine diphosphorylase/glucosamine-1-phosphate N-acetyltransferase GlmU [Kangiella aquimarina]